MNATDTRPGREVTAPAWPPYRIIFTWPDGREDMETVNLPNEDGRGGEGARYWAAGFARTSGAVNWRIYGPGAERVG